MYQKELSWIIRQYPITEKRIMSNLTTTKIFNALANMGIFIFWPCRLSRDIRLDPLIVAKYSVADCSGPTPMPRIMLAKR